MPSLEVFLLGPPQILHGGREVAVDTRKAVALLAYLALTPQRQRRDTLAALLWPEYAQTNARAALRRTLSSLSHAISDTHVEISRETVLLDAESSVLIDVAQFRQLLDCWREHGHRSVEVCRDCLQPLSQAAALYRDDFLAGFALRDSAPFDEWQLQQAETLRRDLGGALDRLAQTQAARGDWEAALHSARRWLALDRLNEAAHRRLMLLYAWSGQRSAAVQRYRECVQALAQDLGVPPLEETTHLYEAITQNRVPAPPAGSDDLRRRLVGGGQTSSAAGNVPAPAGLALTAAPAVPIPPAQAPNTYSRGRLHTPFVGRSQERRALQEAYRSIAGDGRLIIVEGEAGIGKTRLAEEFLTGVRPSGAVVLSVRCYEGEQNLTYGPVVALVRAALGRPGVEEKLGRVPELWLREAARLLPELASQGLDTSQTTAANEPGARARFFEGIRQVLLALCRGPAPAVIFFDDLHGADGATLELLTYMVRRLHGEQLCMMAAWRSEQQPAGGMLQQLAAAARRADICTLLQLGRLSASEVGELVRASGLRAVGPPQIVVDRLYAETEGLPFFLIEYLEALAAGTYQLEGAQWSLTAGVRDLLFTRLRALSQTGWQLLTTAAVIGHSFDFDTLHEASGRTEEEATGALEELVGAAHVRDLPEPGNTPFAASSASYDFSHEKLRALVYQEAGPVRRRLLHRRVAAVMLSRARRGPAGHRQLGAVAGQIAHHYRLAGNEELAAEYYRQAGEHARSLYANAEALAHFRTALALDHPATAALQTAIGDLCMLLGEYRAALNSYEAAAAGCPPGTDGADLARIEHKLGLVYQRRGEWDLAESHLATALDSYARLGLAAESARLYADWSLTALQRGTVEPAEELARQAFALAESGDDRRVLAQATNMLGLLASRRGDTALARSHLERSLALAEELGDGEVRAAALNNLALICGAEGEIKRALELAQAALDLAVARGDRHREAAIHNNIADLLHLAGQSGDAIPHLTQAVAIIGEIGAEAGDLQPAIWKLSGW